MIPERVTQSSVVVIGEGMFRGATLIAGTGAGYGRASFRAFDSATVGGGTVTLAELATIENDSKSTPGGIAVPYHSGIDVSITGTGASAIIYRD